MNLFAHNLCRHCLLLLKNGQLFSSKSAIEKLNIQYSLYIPTVIIKVFWYLPILIIWFKPLTFKKVIQRKRWKYKTFHKHVITAFDITMYRSLFNRVSVIAAPSRAEMLKISKMFDVLIYKNTIRTNAKKHVYYVGT